MLKFIRKPFGNSRFSTITLPTVPGTIKRGDIVFTLTTPRASNPTYDVKHVTMVSKDYEGNGKICVCGHTSDQLDVHNAFDSEKYLYVHFSDTYIIENESADYQSTADLTTATADFGSYSVDSYSVTPVYKTTVKNMQTRLNFLGHNCGTPDGKYGANTRQAIEAFQRVFTTSSGLRIAVDGKAGPQTKEALSFPKK